MYLSRIKIDLGSRAGIGIASNAYEAHQFVYSGFEDAQAARPLYRMESGLDGVALIVQSRIAPTWERALKMRGAGAQWEAKEYSLREIPAGEPLRFKVLANAVKTLRDAKGKTSESGSEKRNRVPIIRDQELLSWLGAQGEKAGFSLVDARVSSKDRITTCRERERPTSTIVLAATLFEGVLVVADFPRFAAAIENGIGHGKAFGLGLISVARQRGE